MLWFTVTPLPESVSQIHAGFLIFKAFASFVRPVHLPLPFFIIGGAADIMSAAILVTGQPPILAEYKIHLAVMLSLKGGWTFTNFLN